MKPDVVLQRTLLDLYAAMSSGEAKHVEAFYTLEAGVVFMGTDSLEFWTDSAQHNADVRPYYDGSRGRLQARPGDALALSEGSVGWTVDRPILTLPDGTELPIRLTVVWHREDDIWRVVHTHASVGG